MSDLEFDILDELYFLIHFDDLKKALGLSDEDLKPLLSKMARKKWLRCYSEPDVELDAASIDIEIGYRNYYYLASKEGLKAHNS
ncbi:MAG: transporter [Reichenbachiella sp.]|uniref:transporter n=1 Tax=Reichenbachiella sp. TaxID=2184521 RepID=UPI003264640A